MLGLKLIRVSKEAPGYKHLTIDSIQVQKYLGAQADVSRVHYDFLADLLWFSGVMLTYHISGHQVIFWKRQLNFIISIEPTDGSSNPLIPMLV